MRCIWRPLSRAAWAVAPAGGSRGGGVVVAAFLAIRVAQQATPLVLAVELAVAAAILAATVAVRSRLLPHLGFEAALVAAAGLAAYAGLAL